jgi:hypothetical protein
MSNPWDLEHLRKIAGIPETTQSVRALHESWDDGDDDDEDEDVKHADDEAKKRKIKLPSAGKVDPDKDLHDLAASKQKAKAKVEEDKPKPRAGGVADLAARQSNTAEFEKKQQAKKEAEKAAAAEKKKNVDPDAPKKKRGKAESETSKSGQLRAFIQRHIDDGQDAKQLRKAAWKWASEECEPPFTPAGFSTIFQSIKSKNAKKLADNAEAANECWILRHPAIPSFILKEDTAMGMYQWISDNDVMGEPLVFESEAEALQVANYLKQFKNQNVDVEWVDLDY